MNKMEQVKNCPHLLSSTNNKKKMREYLIKEDLPNPIVLVNQKMRGPQKWGYKVNKDFCLLSKCRNTNVKSLPSFGSPVGLAYGTLNIADFFNREHKKYSLLQGYATCLIAFGEIYLTPEAEWNHHVLNGILQEGASHFENCAKKFIGEEMSEVDDVSKCFTLRRNGMEIWVSEPIIVGVMECPSARVYSFGVGIAMFLQKYQYCLLRVEDRFYLIWRKNNAYFLFDCYGRMVTCKSDFERGAVALICVCNVKKIDILITYLGQVSAESMYTLYELKMIQLLECCDQTLVCSGLGRRFDYEIISNDHARLTSYYHIATDCFKENRYKQAISMGLISIIYSKIDAPCTWDTSIVNKILIMGNRRNETWTEFNAEKCLQIHDIPRKVLVGQFMADIVVFQSATCGSWINLPDYQVCEITHAIRKFLEELKCSSILVQVDRKVFAIWKRNAFYYLFDPYSKELIYSTNTNGIKQATVHMFNSLKLLCCVLTQDIIGISLPSKFAIHVVKILNLCKVNVQNLPDEAPTSCINPAIKIDIEEAQSLNESIHDICCEQTLACTTEKYEFGHCDLDIPPLSETQNLFESEKVKVQELASTEEEELSEEEKEEEEEQQEEESEEDSEGQEETPGIKATEAKVAKKPKASKVPKKKAKSKESGESTEESDEEEQRGKGKGKKEKGTKRKNKSNGKQKIDESESSDQEKLSKGKTGEEKESKEESDEEEQRGKGKGEKGKRTKGKNKGKGKQKTDDESESFDQEKPSKRKKGEEKESTEQAKKGKVDKGKGKNRGTDKNQTSEEFESDDNKAKSKGRKKKSEKGQNFKDKQEKEKLKKEKKGKEKEKKGKDKSSIKKDKKGTSEKQGNGKDDESEQTSEDDQANKSDHEKDQQEGKGNEKIDKEKSKDNDKYNKSKKKRKDKDKEKGKDKKSRGSETSSDESITSVDEKSLPNIPCELNVSSEEVEGLDKEPQELGKYGNPEKEPKSRWPKGSGYLPKSYPGYTHIPHNLAVVGSEAGTYQSLCQLIRSALQVANRILTMTAWGNYVVFKNKASFLLYDGCTCNPCRFRNIDLSVGTAGLLCFDNMHDIIIEILKGKSRSTIDKTKPLTAEYICNEYC